MSKTVMIVTGESSGELYGALLATEIKAAWPDAQVIGVGGERMKRAGVEVFAGIASALGLTEALSAYRQVKETYAITVGVLKDRHPDVVVLIDYPDFNFRVAEQAGKLGIKVLYYVSPQVWAWRKGRVKTLARLADRMAAVLPFEPEVYRDVDLPCEFVGHPVIDDLRSYPEQKEKAKEALGLDAKPYVALLPGSRNNELTRLLPVLAGVAERVRKEYPDYGMVMPLAPNIEKVKYQGELDGLKALGVSITEENAVLALRAAEAAVIASGTATLQATFIETPTVVIYKVTPFTYMMGKIVLDVDYVSITNIILKKEALPELLQRRANPDAVMKELADILPGGKRRDRMLGELKEVRGMFEGLNASSRVASMVGELAGWQA